jgi:pyruvate-ferredoxin/flavodoxin oxidoreductase
MRNQKAAVDSGHWPLFRYNPELAAEGKNPFKLDSKGIKISFKDYAYLETRYKMLAKTHPQEAEMLMKEAQQDVTQRYQMYEEMASKGDNTENAKS